MYQWSVDDFLILCLVEAFQLAAIVWLVHLVNQLRSKEKDILLFVRKLEWRLYKIGAPEAPDTMEEMVRTYKPD